MEIKEENNLKKQNEKFTEIQEGAQENKTRTLSIKKNLENISNPLKSLTAIFNNLRSYLHWTQKFVDNYKERYKRKQPTLKKFRTL
jgi:molecular chaperone GrpE (heat shock protein)